MFPIRSPFNLPLALGLAVIGVSLGFSALPADAAVGTVSGRLSVR
jgi:hypothetical protein